MRVEGAYMAPEHGFLSEQDELLVHERCKWNEGFSFVAGIDEAGRGCLAGPVVAAAVVFSDRKRIPAGLNDSKKLSPKQRMCLREILLSDPSIWTAVAEVHAPEIDVSDILRATWKAMASALDSLPFAPDFVLVDGRPVKGLSKASQAIVKGDAKSASIAAASILAKTHRDLWMERAAENYPEYAFEVHKGYGTELHLERLRRFGCCPLHRKSFAPVRQILHPPVWIQGDLF